MYLHRYTPDQLGKVRTEYLHELQKRMTIESNCVSNKFQQVITQKKEMQ